MPLNCPLNLDGLCDGCRYLWRDPRQHLEKTCNWHSPPMPLAELLTTDERLQKLESLFEDLSFKIPSRAFHQFRDELEQVKGRQIHIENKIQEHLDEPKKKKAKLRKGEVEV